MLCRVFLASILAASACAQAATPKQVEIYGQKIEYLEAGSGPTVILLHGLGGDYTNWRFTLPALADKFHVYAPDQVGFGTSDKPAINYRIATLVDFLERFYQKLGITKATLVGNSLGGWVAMSFALQHPEQVERLVLVDSAGYSPKRLGMPALTREALLPLNPSTIAGTRQLLRIILYNQALVTDAFAEQAFVQHLRKGDSGTVNSFIDSIVREEDILDGKLGGIRAPTLVVWGREDKLTPLALGKALAEDIPGSRSAILDGCGHVPQIECAQQFNEALAGFLGAPAASGGGQ